MNKRKKSHTMKGVRIINVTHSEDEPKTNTIEQGGVDVETKSNKFIADEDKKFIEKVYSKKVYSKGFKEI